MTQQILITYQVPSANNLTSLNPALNSKANNYSASTSNYGKDGSKVVFLAKMFAWIIIFYFHTEGLGNPEPASLGLSKNNSILSYKFYLFNSFFVFAFVS